MLWAKKEEVLPHLAAASAAAEARFEAELDRDSKRFAAGYVLLCGIYGVSYKVLVHGNNWPVVLSLASAASHALAVVMHHCCPRRRLPLRAQTLYTAAAFFTSMLSAIGNPEAQYKLSTTAAGPILQLFGLPPACPVEFSFDGSCFILMDVSLLHTMMLEVASAFFIIFVLRMKQAGFAAACCFVIYVSMSTYSRWSILDQIWHWHVTEHVVFGSGLAIEVIAKWKITVSSKGLFFELAQKSHQVVQEKVKRCQAEFKCEAFVAVQPKGPCTSAECITEVSSGVAFQGAAMDHAAGSMEGDFHRITKLGKREHWLIDPQQLELQKGPLLGSGTFGVVMAGSFVGTPVAVKVAKNSSARRGQKELMNELRVLRYVRHPNIAVFHGACFDSCGSIAIVLELVRGTRLDLYLKQGCEIAGVGDEIRYSLLLDISRAVAYLHTRQPSIVHGDLKPTNMLVEHPRHSPSIKLLDFGLARVLTPHALPLGGTVMWMAPELLIRGARPPAPAADIFSFGRVAFFVTTGVKPHQDFSVETLRRVCRARRLAPLLWPDLALARRCQRLAEPCMHFTAELRPSALAVQEDLARWPLELGLCEPEEGAWAATVRLGLSGGGPLGAPAAGQERRPPMRGPPSGAPDAGLAAVPPEAAEPLLTSPEDAADQAATHFQPTPRSTRLIILMDMLVRCQWPVSPGACCSFHAALEDLVQLSAACAAQACSPGFFLSSQTELVQCPKCYALEPPQEDGAAACGTCYYEAPRSRGAGRACRQDGATTQSFPQEPPAMQKERMTL